MDGRELDLHVTSSDLGMAVRRQVSNEIGKHQKAGAGIISPSRLKMVAGTGIVSDFVTVRDCRIAEGDEITVIILSPLHGSLNRSGLEVPIDVMEMKMELHEALEARTSLRRVAVAA